MSRRKLAFYCRLSDADEEVKNGFKDESNSISAQRGLLTSFVKNSAELAGYEIMEYFDDGFSGTGFSKREQFQKMLTDAKDGRFECLIVKDFSRLGRDYLEVGNFMEFVFPAMGIRFISVNDNYDSDKNYGMTGGMNVAFKNLIYQMYSRDLSRKVRSARKNRNQNGEYTAAFVKYGYKKDPGDYHKLIIDEETAPYVKEIFERVAGGMATGEVARLFNERKVPTRLMSQREKSRYVPFHDKGDQLWSYNAIYVIIRDEGYTGKLIQNKVEIEGFGDSKKNKKRDKMEWSVVEGGLPQIITRELFEKANAAIRSKKRALHSSKSANLFICPYCRRKLQCSRKDGYYTCKVRTMDRSKPCAKIHLKRKKAEEIVLGSVQDACLIRLKQWNAAENNCEGKEDRTETISRLEAEKSRLENNIISSYKLYQCGTISKEDYIASRTEVKAAIADIEKELDRLECQEEPEQESEVCEWSEVLEQMTSEYNGELLAKVVEKVFIYEDNTVEVVFKGSNKE